MHTMRPFLYSKGKKHTSYFRKTECETARPAFVRIDNLVCNKGKDELLGGLQCMIVSQKHKSGVTLMEVMAVVAIMGILSGLGVAGLRTAIANARIKDAALNVSAYLERTANEARRLDTPLCVKVATGNRKLVTYNKACGSNPVGDIIDNLELESPVKLISNAMSGTLFMDGETQLDNWANKPSGKVGANFEPRLGLSSAPRSGYFAVQYGGKGIYGAALKIKTKNNFVPMMKREDDGSWDEL